MSRARFAATLSLICAAAFPQMTGHAVAEITRVDVNDSGLLGSYGGRQYTWVMGHLEGTVDREDGTSGNYRVPISLMYPDRDSNGFGFVDIPNYADFRLFTDETAPLGQRSVFYSGQTIFSDFLYTEGFTYISVQFARTVTESLGPDYGVIENGIDGYEIIKDASRLLRSPVGLEGLARPLPVEGVIGHGHSGEAGVFRGLVWRGENREDDGSLIFDGLLVTASGARNCRILNNDETLPTRPDRPPVPWFAANEPCPDLPDDGKIILVRTQTDVEDTEGMPARVDLPGFRLYEIAGVSHVPTFIANLADIGAARQNPVDWRPFAKAMLRHLVDWIVEGNEPPSPLYLDGALDGDGIFRLGTDGDGNVLGGVRLPHMPTMLPNGEWAGAPLGVYGGSDPDLADSRYGYAELGGTFEPFPAEELARRYPTREIYVELVHRAAEALLSAGYILQEDHDAYIRAAEVQRW